MHSGTDPTVHEVTKIELYDPKDGKSDSSWRSMVGENPSIEAANLLKDVEKSYDSGKKLIDESEKSTYFRKNEGNLTPKAQQNRPVVLMIVHTII